MGAVGRRLLGARDDVEVVAFPTTLSAAEFQTLLRSSGEVHGAILGLTRFGETECALARGLEVVARIGVGYDAIDVPALTRRRVPLMLAGAANSSSVVEHALFLMLTLEQGPADREELTCPPNRRICRLVGTGWGQARMASGASGVGEVRVMPDPLHAFTMAICRADGSSAEEARLVADHLVLANLFGHDSHGVGMMPAYIQNTTTGHCVRNQHAKIVRDNGAVIVIDGGAGYGQVIAKEAMDIGIERAKKHGVAVVGLKNSHHIGRVGHWAEQCARAGLVSTHWVNVHGHKSLVAPFGGAEPRFTTNPYCTAVPRKGKEPIVLDFATSQVAMGKVRVANNKKVAMDEGLLIDSAGRPTTDPGVMYNAPYGAILPFGLHKGGGLAVICDLLAGALTGGRTHSPRTIKKDGTAIINNMLSIIIDPEAMGGTAMFEDEVETFIGWVKSARPQAGVAEVLAPGEPERQRRADRQKNGVPIDGTTWKQLIDVAHKVRLNDTEIPRANSTGAAA